MYKNIILFYRDYSVSAFLPVLTNDDFYNYDINHEAVLTQMRKFAICLMSSGFGHVGFR